MPLTKEEIQEFVSPDAKTAIDSLIEKYQASTNPKIAGAISQLRGAAAKASEVNFDILGAVLASIQADVVKPRDYFKFRQIPVKTGTISSENKQFCINSESDITSYNQFCSFAEALSVCVGKIQGARDALDSLGVNFQLHFAGPLEDEIKALKMKSEAQEKTIAEQLASFEVLMAKSSGQQAEVRTYERNAEAQKATIDSLEEKLGKATQKKKEYKEKYEESKEKAHQLEVDKGTLRGKTDGLQQGLNATGEMTNQLNTAVEQAVRRSFGGDELKRLIRESMGGSKMPTSNPGGFGQHTMPTGQDAAPSTSAAKPTAASVGIKRPAEKTPATKKTRKATTAKTVEEQKKEILKMTTPQKAKLIPLLREAANSPEYNTASGKYARYNLAVHSLLATLMTDPLSFATGKAVTLETIFTQDDALKAALTGSDLHTAIDNASNNSFLQNICKKALELSPQENIAKSFTSLSGKMKKALKPNPTIVDVSYFILAHISGFMGNDEQYVPGSTELTKLMHERKEHFHAQCTNGSTPSAPADGRSSTRFQPRQFGVVSST